MGNLFTEEQIASFVKRNTSFHNENGARISLLNRDEFFDILEKDISLLPEWAQALVMGDKTVFDIYLGFNKDQDKDSELLTLGNCSKERSFFTGEVAIIPIRLFLGAIETAKKNQSHTFYHEIGHRMHYEIETPEKLAKVQDAALRQVENDKRYYGFKTVEREGEERRVFFKKDGLRPLDEHTVEVQRMLAGFSGQKVMRLHLAAGYNQEEFGVENIAELMGQYFGAYRAYRERGVSKEGAESNADNLLERAYSEVWPVIRAEFLEPLKELQETKANNLFEREEAIANHEARQAAAAKVLQEAKDNYFPAFKYYAEGIDDLFGREKADLDWKFEKIVDCGEMFVEHKLETLEDLTPRTAVEYLKKEYEELTEKKEKVKGLYDGFVKLIVEHGGKAEDVPWDLETYFSGVCDKPDSALEGFKFAERLMKAEKESAELLKHGFRVPISEIMFPQSIDGLLDRIEDIEGRNERVKSRLEEEALQERFFSAERFYGDKELAKEYEGFCRAVASEKESGGTDLVRSIASAIEPNREALERAQNAFNARGVDAFANLLQQVERQEAASQVRRL